MNRALFKEIKEEILSRKSDNQKLFNNIIDFLEYRNSKSFKLLDKYNKNVDLDAIYSVEDNPIVFMRKINDDNEDKIREVHNEMWNLNQAPIGILILPSEIRIYNNYIPPEKEDKFLFPIINADNIENVKNLYRLNEDEIRSGNLFRILENKFAKVTRVDKHLLMNLDDARLKLHKQNNMPYELAHNLLARSIFVKYLEDRNMLTVNTFNKHGVNSFTELLSQLDVEKLYLFFYGLKKRFNGDLFNINPSEKSCVNSDQLDVVYNFFLGTRLATGQLSMFPYDFSIIPVELISNIYETFLNISNKENKSKNGIFYTPHFLADFVLSYSLDNVIEEKNNHEITVLDPACGSGIFLVESFRRLVNKYLENRDGEPEIRDLINILESSIFGIDLSREAVQISIFSLYIALLDYIEPKDIEMNNVKFPNLLGNNIFVGDFFDESIKFNGMKFDVLIGNPPWASSKGKEKKLHEMYCSTHKVPISDRQIAYSFMARAKDFSHDNTLITLIVTSKFLYNHTASKFRRYMLNNFVFEFVMELSLCRDIIFNSATGPAAIISYRYTENVRNNSFVSYYSMKPNIFTKFLKKVVIDPSEVISIKQKEFLKRDSLWKILLFGNSFDLYLIKKLQQNPTIQDLADKYGFVFGQGFKKGSPKKNYEELYNKKFINTKRNNNYLYRYYVDSDNAPNLEDVYLECPGKFDVYKSPHLLIKRGMSPDNRCICSIFLEEAVFTNSINAIAGDNTETSKMVFYYLEGIINSKLYSYYHFHTSSGWAIERDEILIKEHKEAPIVFPAKDNLFQVKKIITLVKKIKDKISQIRYNESLVSTKKIFEDTSANKQKVEQLKREVSELENKIDNVVYELYDINCIDKEIIENTYEISMDLFRKEHKSKALCSINDEELKNYIMIFINHFNYILKRDKKCIKANVYKSSYFFIAINFEVVSLNDKSKVEYITDFNRECLDIFGVATIEEISYDIYVNRKIRGFSKNSFYIIKTNEKKNWTKISARIDLNEFMRDMCSNEKGELICLD